MVPNWLVADVCSRHPDVFVPVISIHPARADAIVELERWAARGCQHVKWLPNSMGIDPSNPRHHAFYRKMKQLGMILLCHTGDESAIAATGGQDMGNPLLLRGSLDLGVRVVALHAASDGEVSDLDDNPLLFDLVVKRTVRHPETGESLLPEAFLEPSGLSDSSRRRYERRRSGPTARPARPALNILNSRPLPRNISG